MPAVDSASILLLRELHNSARPLAATNASVRTSGKLIWYDADRNEAILVAGGVQLCVETDRLLNFNYRIGQLLEVLGEVSPNGCSSASGCKAARPLAGVPEYSAARIRIRARVLRNVEGRDPSLFEKALAIRRRYLAGEGFT